MDISFHAAKNARNIATREISFERAPAFEWDSALVIADTRRGYGECRVLALGLITVRLHVLVFTPRSGKIHIISLRKANKREVERYEAQAQS